MISTSASIFDVLVKIREALLNGELKDGRQITFNYTDFGNEYKALQVLETRRVVTMNSLFLKADIDGNFSVDSTVSFDQKTQISLNDLNEYSKICEELGLMPFDLDYTAELQLIDETTPVVTVGGCEYYLPNLPSSRTTDIIRTAFKNAGNSITKDIIKNRSGLETVGNIKDILRNSYFAANGLLSAFATISPTAITLKSKSSLSEEQFTRIKAVAYKH